MLASSSTTRMCFAICSLAPGALPFYCPPMARPPADKGTANLSPLPLGQRSAPLASLPQLLVGRVLPPPGINADDTEGRCDVSVGKVETPEGWLKGAQFPLGVGLEASRQHRPN